VILLLDGSGSLNTTGWEATKRAATLLVQALGGTGGGTQLSVLLFSGPSTTEKFLLCTKGPGPGQGHPDMESDCGIRWVERGTDNMDSVVAKISAMEWPRATTFTSSALAMAASQLRNGQRNVQAVVVVITDGKPMSPRKTGLAATQIRQKARLMWVLVTPLAPVDQVSEWASHPLSENIIKVPSYGALQEPETISALVADMCPVVY